MNETRNSTVECSSCGRKFVPGSCLTPEEVTVDYGNEPFVTDIEAETKRNHYFRRALWTGKYLQVTLMSIKVGEDVGLERHDETDQFLRVEKGKGLVQMGNNPNELHVEHKVESDSAIMVPAGMWHNITNTGNTPLKLYSIYAPPEHPFGTIHRTKEDDIH